MIDTVRLTLFKDKFRIFKPELFHPHAHILDDHIPYGVPKVDCYQNSSKAVIAKGLCMIKLSAVKRFVKGGVQTTLTVEFSAPKLVYGNNLDELEQGDFITVLKILCNRLSNEMGVVVSEEDLKAATVSAIHFSKNISFVDYTTVNSIINYTRKINLTKRFDLNETKFRNEGLTIYHHSKSLQFILYDKIREMQKVNGRGIEENVQLHLDILGEVESAHKEPLEVLRSELRILKRPKLRSMLKKIGEPYIETFEEFFSKRLSQKMLQQYWNFIIEKLKPVIFAEDFTPQEVVKLILQQNRRIKPQAALSLIGIFYAIKHIGIRPLKTMLNTYFNARSCSRLLSQINDFEFPQSSRFEPFNHISKALSEFKPLKMKDLTLPF
ncbi:hypothetical protein HYW83_05520 [Candidatus Peregrinibacteria bacterium]|nr:hypothetical protein [Candidatus Peregrinibacteria bacterium]